MAALISLAGSGTRGRRDLDATELVRRTKKPDKHVLIVMCLLNDSDGTMKQLSGALAARKMAKDHRVTLVNFEEFSSLEKSRFDEVCFVGHSKFYDERREPVPVLERQIGGYPIARVSSAIETATAVHKVTSIKFYVCETATTVKTAEYDHEGASKFSRDFTRREARVTSARLAAGEHGMVSSLAYLSMNLQAFMSTTHDNRTIKMQGINGVGFFKGVHPRTRAFDYAHIGDFRHILELEGKGETARAEAAEEAFITRYIEGKKSAHKYQFSVIGSY